MYALYLEDLSADFLGTAHLYRCEPGGLLPTFVVVSAVVVFGQPETYIFKATAGGVVAEWGELPGSYKGGLDHAEALRGAGYDVVTP